MFFVDVEIVDSLQPIVDFLLRNKSFKIDELDFLAQVFGQSSFGDDHVLIDVSLFELHDLPVIGPVFFVHVAELVGHLSVDSESSNAYLRISMKSLGVRYFLASVYSLAFSSIF